MKKILFVCTGNTCRSPMAEAIFNKKAAAKGLDVEAMSAGLAADGSYTSDNATWALHEMGIDYKSASVELSAGLVAEAAMVIGITSRHANAVISAFPQFAYKVKTFPTDITDPFGGNIGVYRACRDEISEGIDMILEKITKDGI